MWTSFFWALGIFLLIVGGETLVVDKFVMADSKGIPRLVTGNQPNSDFQTGFNSSPGTNIRQSGRTIATKDWMPWCLLAAGAVTIMYTSSFQRKSGSSA
ncbi:MAG: hypothetical protein KF851_03250 [Pirellulaceae bacterium]|nr:hypothetical protein [Pirellulaceae bacterium]